jgi:hypothetical protein
MGGGDLGAAAIEADHRTVESLPGGADAPLLPEDDDLLRRLSMIRVRLFWNGGNEAEGGIT